MLIEVLLILLILPLYIGIFVIFYRYGYIIKAMSDIENLMSELKSDEIPDDGENPSKRDFLIEKIKNGESISNSKTPWTVERLEKASDKVIDKLYDKYQNPPPVKIDKKEALEMGKPMCPVVIEMYAESLKTLVDQLPYIRGNYTINAEKLKTNISANRLFCDNLAIKIGSKMIEQMGNNTPLHMAVSLGSMTFDAVERVENTEVKSSEE